MGARTFQHKATFMESIQFFVIVSVTALCLSFIFSIFMYHYGMPEHPQRYLLVSFLVSCCVAIPTAVIASQQQFRLMVNHESMQALASTDLLTGLLNRRFFERTIEEEIERMKRTGDEAGLILLDIDMFKRFNDRYGHRFGDEVLKSVAHTAHDELRSPFDRVGRWGGEEFVIMINAVTSEQVSLIAERLRARIEEMVVEFEGKRAKVTASFGCSQLTAEDQLQDVLERADQALYIAKDIGRNRVYSAELAQVNA